MGKIKGFEFPRKLWARIRKMDHCQMTLWAEVFYKNAYRDGKKAAEGLTENEMRDVLLSVKGIGERKAEAIISAVKEAVERKNQGDRETKGEDADAGKEK